MTRRLLFLTKGTATNPASRYRFLHYLPYLESQGFEVTVRPLLPEAYYHLGQIASPARRAAHKGFIALTSLLRRLGHFRLLRDADLILLENQVFPYEPGLLEAALMAINPKVVVEFDDAIYLTPLHRRKLLRSLARAHHIITGNAELARFARSVTDRVSIVPTVVDTSRYPVIPHEPPRSGPVRIGWIGVPSGLLFLERMRHVLCETARRVPVEFYVISSEPWVTEGIPCHFVPWSEAGEVRDLSELDIGIMPLPDTAWARGKCGLKLLQYLAAGRAAVASPVGVNAEIIEHGKNGLLATTDAEWIEALTRLARDEALRRRLGEAGRARMEADYSLDVWAPRVAALYTDLMARPPGHGRDVCAKPDPHAE